MIILIISMQSQGYGQPPITVTRPRDERYSYGQPTLISERVVLADGHAAQTQQDITARTEQPVLVERTVQKQIELIQERAQVYETVVEYPVDIFVEVPKETRVNRDIIIERVLEKPIRRIREVEVETVIEHPTEFIIERPVVYERIVENRIKNQIVQHVDRVTVNKIPIQVMVDKEIRRTLVQPIETEIIQRPVYVPRQVVQTREVDVPVEVPYDTFVDVPVDVIVEEVVYRNINKQIPVQKIVERFVNVPVEKVVEVEIVRQVEAPYEVLVTRDGQRLDTRNLPNYRMGDYQRTRSHSNSRRGEPDPGSYATQPSINYNPRVSSGQAPNIPQGGGVILQGTSETVPPPSTYFGSTQPKQYGTQAGVPSTTYQNNQASRGYDSIPGAAIGSSYTFGPGGNLVPVNQHTTQPAQPTVDSYRPSGQIIGAQTSSSSTNYQPSGTIGHHQLTGSNSYQPSATTGYQPSTGTGNNLPSGTTQYQSVSGPSTNSYQPLQNNQPGNRPSTNTIGTPQHYAPRTEIFTPSTGPNYRPSQGASTYPSLPTLPPGTISYTNLAGPATSQSGSTLPVLLGQPTGDPRGTKDFTTTYRETSDTGRVTGSPTRPDQPGITLSRDSYPLIQQDYNLASGTNLSRNLFPGTSQVSPSPRDPRGSIRDIGPAQTGYDFNRYQSALGTITEEARGYSRTGSSTVPHTYLDNNQNGTTTPSQGYVSSGSRGGSMTGPQFYSSERQGGVTASADTSRTHQPAATIGTTYPQNIGGTSVSQPQAAGMYRSGSQTFQNTTSYQGVPTTVRDPIGTSYTSRPAQPSGTYTGSPIQPGQTTQVASDGRSIISTRPAESLNISKPSTQVLSGSATYQPQSGASLRPSEPVAPQQSPFDLRPVKREVVGETVGQPEGYQEGDRVVHYYVDKIVPKYVEDITERYIDVPVIKEVQVPFDVLVEKVIVNERTVVKQVEVNKFVEGPTVERSQEKEIFIDKVIEKPIYVDKKVIKEKEIVVEKLVEVPTEKFVETIFERFVDVDVDISIIRRKPVFREKDLELTTMRRRRTSHANENLRASLHSSVERMNHVSKENADLKAKVTVLRERANSLTGGVRTEARNSLSVNKKDQYEVLKSQFQSLKDRMNSIKSQEERAKARHSIDAEASYSLTHQNTLREYSSVGGPATRVSGGDIQYRTNPLPQGTRLLGSGQPLSSMDRPSQYM